MKKKRNRRVLVAMSGGIDSSVAVALLSGFARSRKARKKQGNDVIGVFMKFWSPTTSGGGLVRGWNRCCSPEAEKRARAVAQKLCIPFYVLNLEKEFKKRVVDRFLAEYKKGNTPNPCVVCNKEIKFGLLLEKALKLGADFIATGHYARIEREKNKYKLLTGKDKEKDQSYFLWQLNQKQLSRILFPIGDYTKAEVRKLAKKFKLPVLNIPESQEICFIPTTIEDFLSRYLKIKPGDILDVNGKKIGKHKGLSIYTIGQRKGIGLANGPYWALDKNLKKNILIVTKEEKDLEKKELFVKNVNPVRKPVFSNVVNWISGKTPKLPIRVKAKIRYRSKLAPATIYKILNTRYKILFDSPQRAITPGQSVVFYKGNELLGGGIIS